MNPDEIIKATPELLKHGAELVGALKLTEIAKTILGPATGEFAERVKDEIRLYRFGRQLELLKKAEKMVQDAGFTPKAVPIKLLFPLLEGASLEEDEDLHTMWAALLANASMRASVEVRPSYAEILAQLSPPEAMLLTQIHLHVDKNLTKHYSQFPKASNWAYLVHVGTWKTVLQYYAELLGVDPSVLLNRANTSPGSNKARSNFRVSFENLLRLGLLREDQGKSQSRPVVRLTALGYDFVIACQPPKPKS